MRLNAKFQNRPLKRFSIIAVRAFLILQLFQFLGVEADAQANKWFLPVGTEPLRDWKSVGITPNGMFGVWRDLDSSTVRHFHAGVDIMRVKNDYDFEPVRSAWTGKVVSVDPVLPFSTVLIEHVMESGVKIWTVYKHISGISVLPGDIVVSHHRIARFMNRKELGIHGRKFDHLHFEILKKKPRRIRQPGNPHLRYMPYSVECDTKSKLMRYYHDPMKFITVDSRRQW